MEELKKLKEIVKWTKSIPEANSFDWYMERVEYFTKELFKYSKFKVGDIVVLNKTPVINDKEAWGWIGYKDILIKGTRAKVQGVDHYAGRFRYLLDFIITDNKTVDGFTFYEDSLRKE